MIAAAIIVALAVGAAGGWLARARRRGPLYDPLPWEVEQAWERGAVSGVWFERGESGGGTGARIRALLAARDRKVFLESDDEPERTMAA